MSNRIELWEKIGLWLAMFVFFVSVIDGFMDIFHMNIFWAIVCAVLNIIFFVFCGGVIVYIFICWVIVTARAERDKIVIYDV